MFPGNLRFGKIVKFVNSSIIKLRSIKYNYLNTLGYENKRLGPTRIGDKSLKQDFYFMFTYDIRKRHRKAKPSVRVRSPACERA